ncbi:hypothetical protein [Kitasatospora griseola]|uniref:hypothetical protein n=1 Tax=Kitasatospora griseola TaxID=2064 RepID=UPI00167167D2|nr:hypothetical protein [Kitasatospora griseola]
MPHVTDRARLKQYQDLLSVPQDVLRAAALNGRIKLDTEDIGQENFQALLWDLLFSSSHSHPWDHRGGRSFRGLAGYVEWIMPAPHQLTIQASVAPRVANYLLPKTVTYTDGSHVHFGIPGLRIERVTARAVHLLHLPTQGRLELREYHRGSLRTMRSRLRWETGSSETSENLAFWYTAGITAAEESASPHWDPTPCTPLRSRLMVRASTWWRHWPHTAEIVPPRRSNTSRCLTWRKGPSPTEVCDLLVNSVIRIAGAVNVSSPNGLDGSLLRLGSAAIELTRPS